ncbi:hypothetical protein D1BOALGB6SA_5620 [Olavius sp. associated proteobacterium Delta 1]|nr:hypothetical protein D1BOALGB6SA_5620 [Olavius sp. associated proteobacterium Delta 1]
MARNHTVSHSLSSLIGDRFKFVTFRGWNVGVKAPQSLLLLFTLNNGIRF